MLLMSVAVSRKNTFVRIVRPVKQLHH